MSSSTSDHERSTGIRHSKEDALSEREFELLLEGAARCEDYYGLQARFVILVCGRLGLRVGELAHMRESWVDWRRQVIEIPRHQPCDKGRGGGICGVCEQHARQMVDVDPSRDLDAMRARLWGPKTDQAVRDVPFDFDARAQLVLERFFDRFDRWPVSQQAANRRVNRAAREADGLSEADVYPHCLRSTAASYHAGRGLDTLPMQALMGWAQASTAECYVSTSTKNTRRALHMIHSG